MAGRGPAPKDPSRRARRNAGPELRVIEAEPAAQPELPTFEITVDDKLLEFSWPQRTVEWWAMWGAHPLSAEFTASDWEFLLDTAVLHARFWSGALNVAGELRLRVAKFGATPEDRARLRVQFAQADEADEKRGTRQSGSRERYQGLRLAE